MTVWSEDGRTVNLDLARPDHRHWEHGYASTVYKSQGKTSQDVLVHAPTTDKDLLSQKAFLVAISRQKENITIVTDDREKLERNVKENLGEKTSALESRSILAEWSEVKGAFLKAEQKDHSEQENEQEKQDKQIPIEKEEGR